MSASAGSKFDAAKVPWGDLTWSLLGDCFLGLKGICAALLYGKQKYCAHGWISVPDGERRYRNAALRHFMAASEGEEIDEESKIPHVYLGACSALFAATLYAKRVLK